MAEQIEVPQTFKDYLQHRAEIVAAYLFGSVAAGKAHKFSDVDVALLLVEPVDRDRAWEIRLEAMGEAETAFGGPMQVEILRELGSLLKYQIIHHGQLIFERDRSARIWHEVAVRNEYWDFEPYLEQWRQAALRRMRLNGL